MNTSRSSLSLLAAAPDPNDFDYEALFQGDELLLGDENTYSKRRGSDPETLAERPHHRMPPLRSSDLRGEDIRKAEEGVSIAREDESSLQDMRFFQHFMLQCYPHHPIGNENIWTHEVPCLSQSHEFLMHAILGMAACDLMNTDPSLLAFAMAHRVKAIKAIKKSLAELPRQKGTTSEHANALVATCFALTFQSVTFEDGMPEYMTFIRGILIIGTQMWIKGIKPIFVNIIGEDSHAVLEPKMADLPLIQKGWADGAVEAIGGLRGLCRDVVEIEYFDLIMEMATKLHTSSWEAYQTLTKHYGWWIQLPHEKFQRIIDMGNQTMVLLASHWIALKQIMAFITNAEHECREKAPPQENAIDLGIIRWLGYLNKQVDHEHLIYNQWPLWVESQLNQDLGFFGKRY
ncbi:sterol regulatory element-binding protein ECM22 [Colletotrichum liriopes]|uniref:Sterol regulatory element-binding protein ECM22 n=1 Tax=Colletotrichum liriopes TaxID=708192 RepID=A0AA37GKE9_9PEZI|nr:sterol regulatory element-binding protein ECM22 [Colletotrichum liriopes]